MALLPAHTLHAMCQSFTLVNTHSRKSSLSLFSYCLCCILWPIFHACLIALIPCGLARLSSVDSAVNWSLPLCSEREVPSSLSSSFDLSFSLSRLLCKDACLSSSFLFSVSCFPIAQSRIHRMASRSPLCCGV